MNKVIVHLFNNEYYAEVYAGTNMTPYGEYNKNRVYTKEYIEAKIVSIFGPSVFEYI